MGGNLGEVRRHWREDGELRRLVRWAASSGDGRLKRIALTIVAAIDDAEAESLVRAMMFGSDLEPEMKMHIAAILKLRGADMREMLPNDGDLDSVILPDAEPLLEGLPVGERQLIRYAGEVLEDEWDVSAPAALAVLWARYRQGRGHELRPDHEHRRGRGGAGLFLSGAAWKAAVAGKGSAALRMLRAPAGLVRRAHRFDTGRGRRRDGRIRRFTISTRSFLNMLRRGWRCIPDLRKSRWRTATTRS